MDTASVLGVKPDRRLCSVRPSIQSLFASGIYWGLADRRGAVAGESLDADASELSGFVINSPLMYHLKEPPCCTDSVLLLSL